MCGPPHMVHTYASAGNQQNDKNTGNYENVSHARPADVRGGELSSAKRSVSVTSFRRSFTRIPRSTGLVSTHIHTHDAVLRVHENKKKSFSTRLHVAHAEIQGVSDHLGSKRPQPRSVSCTGGERRSEKSTSFDIDSVSVASTNENSDIVYIFTASGFHPAGAYSRQHRKIA
ncbi:uncharacterized protein LOC143348333 [Colletes latitarsis]|uniref:uncharacterized protein LOC143348333 n=1 Tax=Colletes latitarsis TaxID=2605962 RepID=UPI004036CF52